MATIANTYQQWIRQVGLGKVFYPRTRQRIRFWSAIAGNRDGCTVTQWDRYLSWLEYYAPSDTTEWLEFHSGESGNAPSWDAYWESQYIQPNLTGLSEWLQNWQ